MNTQQCKFINRGASAWGLSLPVQILDEVYEEIYWALWSLLLNSSDDWSWSRSCPDAVSSIWSPGLMYLLYLRIFLFFRGLVALSWVASVGLGSRWTWTAELTEQELEIYPSRWRDVAGVVVMGWRAGMLLADIGRCLMLSPVVDWAWVIEVGSLISWRASCRRRGCVIEAMSFSKVLTWSILPTCSWKPSLDA